MADHSSPSKTETNSDRLFDITVRLTLFARDTAREFWRGVRENSIPWFSCCGVGVFFAVVFTLRLDALVWKLCHVPKLYPFRPLLYWSYVTIYTTSGFWLWSVGRAVARRALASQLTEVFRSAGLETRTKRLPGLIANDAVDTHLRKLKVSSVGIPESEFQRAKPSLESGLQIFIDQIKANVERGTVDLLYAYTPLPKLYPYDAALKMKPFTFRVGMTRTRPLDISLRDVPHVLAAGYTNSGKSGFVRQALLTLMLGNPGIEFTLIDLKSGLELGIFSGIPGVKLYSTPLEAIQALRYVESQLEKRMGLLRANRCSDFDAFYRLPDEKRTFTADWPKEKTFIRHVVAIDEAAELFMAGTALGSKEAQVAKRLTAKIAALGRAVGIHLIVSTQRPDRYAVDPLIKSNLQGRLCFPMSDNASSMTILDSVRAADLPPIQGRAIWRSGFDLIEVQVPWLDRDAMEPLLAPLRQQKSVGSEAPAVESAAEVVAPQTPASAEDGITQYEEGKDPDGSPAPEIEGADQ